MIKFNKFNVVNTETKIKARVWYSINGRVDGRDCVTIYEKDFKRELHRLFKAAINESEFVIDYFEESRVVLFTDHPLYAQALERAKLER